MLFWSGKSGEMSWIAAEKSTKDPRFARPKGLWQSFFRRAWVENQKTERLIWVDEKVLHLFLIEEFLWVRWVKLQETTKSKRSYSTRVTHDSHYFRPFLGTSRGWLSLFEATIFGEIVFGSCRCKKDILFSCILLNHRNYINEYWRFF